MSEGATDKPTVAEATPGPAAPARVSPRVLIAPAVLLASVVALAAGIYLSSGEKPGPDIAGMLQGAKELAAKGEHQAVLEELNGPVLKWVNAGMGEPEDLVQFFLLRARAMYQAQSAAGVSRAENYQAALNDYAAARKRGGVLEPEDVIRVAMSLLELGKTEEALKESEALSDREIEAKKNIVKLAVTRNLREPRVHFDDTLNLLIKFTEQPNLTDEEGAWALARQAELLLGAGKAQDAVTKLLRDMQLLPDLAPEAEAELAFLLGRAYYAGEELSEAAGQLERAIALADGTSDLHAKATVLLGQIRQATGQLDEAKDLYTGILEHSADTPEYLGALLGRASVSAVQGNDERAMHDYAELIEKLPAVAHGPELSPELIAEGLMARHTDRLTAGQTRQALRYAAMAESLFALDRTPTGVLLALAASNRRLADELMAGTLGHDEQAGGHAVEHGEVDLVTREEAKHAYLAAGGYYARHAGEVVIENPDSATQSRWLSADSYDLGGDVEETIKAFGGYLEGAPGDDPRRQEGKFRFAQVFQSTGDLGTAVALYREIIEERDAAADRGGALWAARSIVPMAQCYLADADLENDAEGERELLGVLSGREFSPQAAEFRDALFELGRYYYQSGQYTGAIERLREAAERFPDDPQIERVRYRLADSLRLSAGEIGRVLQQAMPQSRRDELETARKERLRDALGLFDRVRASLMSVKPESLGPVEGVYLRNASFYLGDCAYELGEFDAAIAAYDSARQRYDADPASLVALVQIVNAYVQQGQWAKAITANERARQHLARFPEDVWKRADLPMDKRHWERWLDSRSLMERHARAGAEP